MQLKDSTGKAIVPLTYNNSTWLPVRAISEMLNVGVEWNAKTNIIDIKAAISPAQMSAIEIQSHLISNYSILKTSIGYTSFTFDVIEGTALEDYDLWINILYDDAFITNLQKSVSLTQDQKIVAKNELRIFSEKIGRDLINIAPGIKLKGALYKFWYAAEDTDKKNLLLTSYMMMLLLLICKCHVFF